MNEIKSTSHKVSYDSQIVVCCNKNSKIVECYLDCSLTIVPITVFVAMYKCCNTVLYFWHNFPGKKKHSTQPLRKSCNIMQ
jgi:hypothetical protein